MVFSVDINRARRNIEKLSVMVQAVPGQLILILWQTEARGKIYAAEDSKAIAHFQPMDNHYLLGILDPNPRPLDWDKLILPVAKYLVASGSGLIESGPTVGPIGKEILSNHQISFVYLQDPEPEDYRLVEQYSEVHTFVGDERVTKWFLAQEHPSYSGESLINLWKKCRLLEYNLNPPAIDQIVEMHCQSIIVEMADALVVSDDEWYKSQKIAALRGQVLEFNVDLEKVFDRAQAKLRRLLGI